MKLTIRVLISLLCAWGGGVPDSAADDEADWRPLFSGADFSDGNRFTEPAGGHSRTRAAVNEEDLMSGDPSGIFRIRNGEVHAYPDARRGEPVSYGYLATEKTRSHYRLRFEFRRGEKKFAPRRALPQDAGVLFHAALPGSGAVRGIECELEKGRAGGLVLLPGTQATTAVERISLHGNEARHLGPDDGGEFFTTGGRAEHRILPSADVERKGWNTVELIVRGAESVTHLVNGEVVAQATDLRGRAEDGTWQPLESGRIVFRAKASEIVYRNIEIAELEAPAKSAVASREERPPNVIFVLVDNLGYGDIGCFGSTLHRTPNLDRMAEEGAKLTSFYSAAPVCTPSRASFLTGCYPRRVSMHVDANGTQVLGGVTPRGLNPDEPTIAQQLKGLGYVTACFGKWHLGEQRPFLPRQHGFDVFFGLPYSEDMGEREAWDFRAAMPPLPLIENETVIEAPTDPAGLTGRFTERAVAFLEENRNRPFFLYLPHTMPGSTRESFASERFRGKSANGTYGDAVEELDWSMGEILRALEENGLDENTLVMWTSDNGPQDRGKIPHGDVGPLHGWGYSTDEGGMRMPFVARWPGRIPGGTVSDEVTTAMDLLPTILGLAGGDLPEDHLVDGHDVWPILSGTPGAQSPHDAFFYYFLGQLQAVRSGKWKLYLPLEEKWDRRRWRDEVCDPAPLKLVDLDADIAELHDLSGEHPEVVKRLTAHAERAREELGDIGKPGLEQRPPGHHPDPRPLWLYDVKKVKE